MKKTFKYLIALAFIAWLGTGCVGPSYVTQTPVEQPLTYQSFYDDLSPYGNWIDYPEYGNVWSPRVGEGFRPYATNGQWRYSNDGWAWQSNYNWGWATFHYGRWLYDDNYGWLWTPGYDWSPAWVTWGSVDNYYAWAPLTPEVNIGSRYNSWRPHGSYWNVVPRGDIGDRNISTVIIQHNNNSIINNNVNITKNITIINNYNTSRTNNYYAKGPDVREVERYSHNTYTPVQFKDVHQIRRPSQSNQQSNVMEVYRPVVQRPQSQNNNQGNQYNSAGNPAGGYNRPPANQPNSNYNNSNNVPREENTQPRTYGDGRENPIPPVNQPYQNNNNVNNIPHDQNTQPRNDGDGRGNSIPPPNQPYQNNNNGNNITHDQNTQPRNNGEVRGNTYPPANTNNNSATPVPQRPQNLPAPQQLPPRNNNPVRNTPRQNIPDQNGPQPRRFKIVDPAQMKPIREQNQVPVNQPQQQRRNVQQLPVQRAPQGNNNNRNQRPGERQN
jgi:hypothetical protein